MRASPSKPRWIGALRLTPRLEPDISGRHGERQALQLGMDLTVMGVENGARAR